MKLHPNQLKELCKQKKLTQDQVAGFLGHQSSNRVSRWEAGKALPNAVNALALCRLYATSLESVFPQKPRSACTRVLF